MRIPMLKNDFEKWNQDDWLAKEIEREKKISAWDLDEGNSVRLEHEEDCERRQVADEHFRMHKARIKSAGNPVKGGLSAWFVFDIVLMVVLFIVNAFLPRPDFGAPILLFLSINPGIFIWIFLLKRFPSENYCRAVFIIALLIEFYTIFVLNQRALSYLMWRLLG